MPRLPEELLPHTPDEGPPVPRALPGWPAAPEEVEAAVREYAESVQRAVYNYETAMHRAVETYRQALYARLRRF